MWREIKIHAVPSLETHCNEQPNRIPWKIFCCDVIFYTTVSLCLILIAFAIGCVVFGLVKSEKTDTQIRFSIVSVLVSSLNPNASSSPLFHIVFQAEIAFENGTEMCLHSISTTISYHGIKIARDDEDESGGDSLCYQMEKYWTEIVFPVPMLLSVPRYLQKQLWEEREITVLDLEMDFQADSSNNYHVWCNGVTLGAMDTPIPCNVTM